MKTFLSDFDILTNKRVMPHHSFTVQLTTISADDDITRNDGTYLPKVTIHAVSKPFQFLPDFYVQVKIMATFN